MATVNIHPSPIHGRLQAPPSKSCMQRACAAALLKGGETIIHNYGTSNDDNAAIEIIKQLGATVIYEDGKLLIHSIFNPLTNSDLPLTINCNESGLSLRMFTSIAALLPATITITGKGSLLNRPIDFFNKVLPILGVAVSSNEGKLPIEITGSLKPKDIEVDGSLSSQFLTGLLFAYSYKNTDAIITVNSLKSKPYIDVTLAVMQDFGMQLPVNKNYQEFIFNHQPIQQSTNQPLTYTVEGDWSNAAFLLVAGAIAGSLTITGLQIDSAQADKAIVAVLKIVGCNIVIAENDITITASNQGLKSFDFDATDCPDLFPPLVALAAYCKGITTIKGVQRLTHKESNRAIVLQEEFGKMGVAIELRDDTMFITGTEQIKAATVHSHNDHRIAMACAVAALKASGTITITDAQAIHKSYPAFYDDLKKVGASVTASPSAI